MQIFPANNIWNAPIDKLPVQSNSAALINTIGASQHLRLDDSFPINVGANIPLVNLGGIGGSDSQSDPNPYGIPDNVVIEAGSDGHALIVDTATNVLTEIFALSGAPGSWTCGSAAKWDLGSNAQRPYLFTSADAAGLPILPGLVRYEEIAAGKITHALRMTIQNASLYGSAAWPARHFSTSGRTDASIYPAMGQRFRLKASFDISGFSPTNQIILRALKQYGCMVADNGLPFAMQYAADPRWNAADLTVLHNITGANMEAVDATALMVTAESMAVGAQGNRVLVTDALGRSNAVALGAGLAIVNGQLTVTGSAVVTTDPPPSTPTTSLFPPSAVPAVPWIADGGTPVTLGLIFISSVDATVKGVRYYRGIGNSGPHVGLLYSGDGKEMARTPFFNETLIGWQTTPFPAPLAIKANTPYVVAVFTTSGFAVNRPDAFGAGIINGTLRGLKGVYYYAAAPTFPTLNYQDSNYWVDVLLA